MAPMFLIDELLERAEDAIETTEDDDALLLDGEDIG
jgi:hypothetical protein